MTGEPRGNVSRCADWLEEDTSLVESKPILVRCEKPLGHAGEHGHGRFGWSANGWSEEAPEWTQAVVQLAADAGDEEARAYLDEDGVA